ncbi:MAG: hypothetical protein AMXMBFR64_32800 [Myxococcales bacterium]
MRTPAPTSRHLWLLGLLAAHVLAGMAACKGSDDAAEAPAAPAANTKKADKGADKADKGADKASKGADKADKGADKASKGADKADKTSKGADKTSKGADKANKGADDADKGADEADKGTATKGSATKDAPAGQAQGGPAPRAAAGTPAPSVAPRTAAAGADKLAPGARAEADPPALPVTDSSALAPRGGEKGLVVDPGPSPVLARAAAPAAPRGADAAVVEPSLAVAPRGATPEDRARPVAPPTDRGGSPEAGPTPPAIERLGSPERVAPALRPVEAPVPPSDRVAASSTPERGAAPSPRIAPVRPAGAPLDISQALTASELKVLSGGKAFKQGTLAGREGDPSYNSLYFAPAKGGAYGVGVQVWYEPTIRDTRTRYEDMKLTYPNVQETGNVTNYTYFAFWNDVYYLVFMGLKQRLVISVTASNETLSPNQLFAVATKVRDRLIR